MSNDPTQYLEAVDARLERIESKLDNHLQRVSAAEKDIEWLRGHVRIATTVFLSAIAGMAAILSKWLFDGQSH
jgi:hypothetical protein